MKSYLSLALSLTVSLALSGSGIAGCSNDDAPTPPTTKGKGGSAGAGAGLCTPNQTVFCRCGPETETPGEDGYQTCSRDGTGFGPCGACVGEVDPPPTTASCGNAIREGNEDCDDGNGDNTDGCTKACRFATCGDGFIRAGTEECDDSNSKAGDGCSPACKTEKAGEDPCKGAGAECPTGKMGECGKGTLVCQNMALVCVQAKQPTAKDACGNGLDDDCNGSVDDNNCPCAHDMCDPGVALAASCTFATGDDSNKACLETICENDGPICCGSEWDATCVKAVQLFCGRLSCEASKGACSHTLCTTGAALVPDCDKGNGTAAVSSCVKKICEIDADCCGKAWDQPCVDRVINVCGKKCDKLDRFIPPPWPSEGRRLSMRRVVLLCLAATACSADTFTPLEPAGGAGQAGEAGAGGGASGGSAGGGGAGAPQGGQSGGPIGAGSGGDDGGKGGSGAGGEGAAGGAGAPGKAGAPAAGAGGTAAGGAAASGAGGGSAGGAGSPSVGGMAGSAPICTGAVGPACGPVAASPALVDCVEGQNKPCVAREGRRFQIRFQTQSYCEAEAACASNSGDGKPARLYAPSTDNEAKKLFERFQFGVPHWVGGFQTLGAKARAEGFVWNDGSSTPFPWALPSPNDGGAAGVCDQGKEDCVRLIAGSSLSAPNHTEDHACSASLQALCESPIIDTTCAGVAPLALSEAALEDLPGAQHNADHLFVPTRHPWCRAKATCQKLGYHLAAPTTQASRTKLAAYAKADVWVDAAQEGPEPKFFWRPHDAARRSAVGAAGFRKDEPDDAGGPETQDEDCLIVDDENGLLRDAWCGEARPFVCRKGNDQAD